MSKATINPNLKHLRIFVEIARRGSFRSAAQTLHLSEPATSQAMTQLEGLLGVKLLDRTTRVVRATEAGTLFLTDAERMLEGLDRSVVSVRDFAATGRGTVTLSCLSSTVFRLLPPALSEMKVLHPAISVLFKDDSMRGILKNLDEGDCDIAIVSDDAMNHHGIDIPLVKDAFQVVCPNGHPLARLKQVAATDLAKHDLVLLRRGSGIRDTFDRAIEKRGHSMTVVHETTQIHTLLGLVEAGVGVTVLPAMLCPPVDHPIAVRPLARPTVSRTVGIVFPPGKEASPASQALAEAIQRALSRRTASLPPGVTRFR